MHTARCHRNRVGTRAGVHPATVAPPCQDPSSCSALNFLVQSVECSKPGDSLGDVSVPLQWRLPPRQRQADGTIIAGGGGYARAFLALGFFVDPETRGAEDTWRGIGRHIQ